MKEVFALLSLILSVFSGCHDVRNDCILSCLPRSVISPLPINMNSLQGLDLEADGWIYLDGPGTGDGLIIFKVGDREYKAYDRNPPDLCQGQDTRLEVENGIVAVCPKNRVRWNLYTGEPKEGASCPLIEYYTQYDPAEDKVYISNW